MTADIEFSDFDHALLGTTKSDISPDAAHPFHHIKFGNNRSWSLDPTSIDPKGVPGSFPYCNTPDSSSVAYTYDEAAVSNLLNQFVAGPETTSWRDYLSNASADELVVAGAGITALHTVEEHCQDTYTARPFAEVRWGFFSEGIQQVSVGKYSASAFTFGYLTRTR